MGKAAMHAAGVAGGGCDAAEHRGDGGDGAAADGGVARAAGQEGGGADVVVGAVGR